MSGKLILVILFVCFGSFIKAQTPAHRKSAFAIVDPFYQTNAETGRASSKEKTDAWIYGYSELESWRLQELIRQKDAAKLKVGYPGVFHQPYHNASFRLILNDPVFQDSISFQSVGYGRLFINGELINDFPSAHLVNSVTDLPNKPIRELQFDLMTDGEPPALFISDPTFSTAIKSWEWKAGGEDWQPAYHFPKTGPGVPPHKSESPEHLISPEKGKGNLYDFGRELLGYVQVKSEKAPHLSVGESEKEAMDTTNTVIEQSLDMEMLRDGLWKSKSPLAFRYIYAAGVNGVCCYSISYPAIYKGAFACSDRTLTRIWMNSAYTLRLCMHDFLIDGIKRDRLPWAGDLAMSMMVNAFTFADQEIVRRSLTVLGRAGIQEKNINGILDYSLWWIISQDCYQQYFDDKQHLDREWERIKTALKILTSKCDEQGFLKTADLWVFIDWVDQEKWTALQILWWWAQQSGIHLANKMNDWKTADELRIQSEELKDKLLRIAWDDSKGIWIGNPEHPERISKHANFLAVTSDLSNPLQYKMIRTFLTDEKVSRAGTPYMAGFENMALAQTGDVAAMINRIKDYWGGMLALGATTFWEAYNPEEKNGSQFSFYDRPYGKSLCHAWSSGPAAILPSEILGIKILEDGWKRFSINPNLGRLKWVNSSIPTPYGNIIININKKRMILNIPAGTTAEWKGENFTGPLRMNKILDSSPDKQKSAKRKEPVKR